VRFSEKGGDFALGIGFFVEKGEVFSSLRGVFYAFWAVGVCSSNAFWESVGIFLHSFLIFSILTLASVGE
jgi:hypothetical protein